jgi:hypothetical protein
MKKLYHVTTESKARKYHQSGEIHKPVRGFDTLLAACVWAMRIGRKVVYEINNMPSHKMPDHHNSYGNAYWIDENVPIENIKCVVSPEK